MSHLHTQMEKLRSTLGKNTADTLGYLLLYKDVPGVDGQEETGVGKAPDESHSPDEPPPAGLKGVVGEGLAGKVADKGGSCQCSPTYRDPHCQDPACNGWFATTTTLQEH